MTELKRTDLPTSSKIQLAASAFIRQGEYGSKTELARYYRVSRPTVYSAAETAGRVLGRHFCQPESGGVCVIADKKQIDRAIASLRVVAPNSIRAIEDLLPILYPGVRVSYGKIQQTLIEIEEKAADFNNRADLSGIEAGAIDEMYSQGNPVLAGLDMDSGYLFSLELRNSRSGDDWCEVLEKVKKQGLELKKIVKDAGQGMAFGSKKVFPDAEQRDDCFHAFYAMGKIRMRLEQKAYAAINREQKSVEKLNDVLLGTDKHKWNWRGIEKIIEFNRRESLNAAELHDAFEIAMREVIEAMEYVDLETGKIRSAQEMESSIKKAAMKMMELSSRKCSKVGRYIINRAAGLAVHMKEMNGAFNHLADKYGETSVQLACVICRLNLDLQQKRRPWNHFLDRKHLLGALSLLHNKAGDKTYEILDAVDDVVQKRHRASSAIEGFNAALRPFLYVQKGVSQGFLELFRAYHNLKTRRWGRHKGTSAQECLTGKRVSDWLTVIGYPAISAAS